MRRSLLRRRDPSRLRPLRPYTTLGCPMIHGKATWCRGLCEPIKGRGVCGRLAPHAMKTRIQLAISRYNARQARARLTAAG